MSEKIENFIKDKWIVANRRKKNSVDPQKPYAWLVEKERAASGKIENTAIIFLTNRECPFHCLMCDLWKNTTDKSVSVGAIPNQIEWALKQMPEAKHLKLYNSGSFFDKKAISEEDYGRIGSLVSGFETVIVESHPKFINERCLRFRDMIKPELHVAIGLETVHPEILLKLNKQMNLEDFRNSVSFLTQNGIPSRAFILLKTPFQSEPEGVYWAKKSIAFAFGAGVECCTVIPVRAGNGAMDLLMEKGDFSLPNIHSLETVLEYGISLNAGRVFADVWDLGLFSVCEKCIDQRTGRLTDMNLSQRITSRVTCSCDFDEFGN
ncbi:MAG: radical SAM protein [Bacteroidetes bacterium HGW-Bacteroidetes-15]|nr:MAG: radical SAM protein [Bacteroidetes bacterium HGW-Bacteroidetes-15]